MEDNKYSANNENKLSNTRIELRKEVLKDIRRLCDKVATERYSEQELKIIIKELKEIAEMIRDKDSMMEVRQELESRKNKIPQSELIIQVRKQIIETIKLKKDVIVGQYDSEELEVVGQNVDEMIGLIQDKDSIMEVLNQKKVAPKSRENPHISKIFKLDELEEK